MAREGVFGQIDPALAPPAARPLLALARLIQRRGAQTGASGLVTAFARLGPSYVKLGQFLATRPDVVGTRASRELEKLQDRMPPFPRAVAVGIVESTLEQKIADIFLEFGEPVAAASVAQVHRARVKDGDVARDVAVKILRPGVEARFARDLSDMYFAARLAEKHHSEARRLRVVEVVDTLARGVRMEMDFRLEAAAASEFAENCARDADFRVPTVDWNRTGRDVLTLEWIDGIPLSHIDELHRANIDLPQLARVVIQ